MIVNMTSICPQSAARRALMLSQRRFQYTHNRLPAIANMTKRTHFESSTATPPPPPPPSNGQEIPTPTRQQLRSIAMYSALPMIGFGLMDQTIMIHAGNAIDCTIGVTLGLSTLAAAAVGQIVANAGGILFGETLQHFFTSKLSLIPSSNLSAAQMSLASVSRAKLAGTFWGLVLGCTLGLLNLLLIDTERSSNLKMIHALREDGEVADEFAFEIDISNQQQQQTSSDHDSVTTLTVRGPDVDGIMAALVTVLTEEGLSLVELSAKQKTREDGEFIFEDVFLLRREGQAIPEEELDGLAKKLWEATRSPLNVPTLTAKLKESELRNQELEERIDNLVGQIQKKQVNTTSKKKEE